MKHLGFERVRIRVGNVIRPGFEAGDNETEKAQFIKIRLDEENSPEAYIANRAKTPEWETAAPGQEQMPGLNKEEAVP
jgi:hypothetical protein